MFTTDEKGELLDIQVIIDKVFRALSDKKTLFIFDNIKNGCEFCSWLPILRLKAERNPHLLDTLQLSDLPMIYSNTFELQELPECVAFIFLRDRIPPKQFDNVAANTNIKMIGCLPLALQLAVAYGISQE